MNSPPPLHLQLLPLPDQSLLIEVQGPSAPRIRRGLLDDPDTVESLPGLLELTESEPDPEMPLADPVELFLRALNAGLLNAASHQPWSCRGSLSLDTLDRALSLKRWQLELHDVHLGTFRVLRNLLRSLEPEQATLRTLTVHQGARPVTDVAALPYPPAATTLPFQVSRDEAVTNTGCSVFRLIFCQPLEERAEVAAMAALDSWAHLLMLGGYLDDPDAATGRLGAAPSPPVRIDPQAIEMTFEIFNSEPAALDAAINLAHRLHHLKAPIEALEFE